MKRIPVISSNIAEIGYEPESGTLEVLFRSNSVYQYYDVPSSVYKGLMKAPSHGRYLAAYVKKGGYAYREVSK